MSKADIQKWARLIDHTNLQPQRRTQDIERLCAEALEWNFYAVCVTPKWVSLCSKLLAGSSTIPITVVGFPLGANLTETKVDETKRVIDAGAKEIDMVLDIGAVIDDDWTRVGSDIAAVAKACATAPLKVILETAYLNRIQIQQACRACRDHGASFVKTSTGFAPKGAEVETVRLMRDTVGPDFGVKASGGIKDAKALQAFVAAGANRVGTSSSHLILKELSELAV